jgi:hypothetical protein
LERIGEKEEKMRSVVRERRMRIRIVKFGDFCREIETKRETEKEKRERERERERDLCVMTVMREWVDFRV